MVIIEWKPLPHNPAGMREMGINVPSVTTHPDGSMEIEFEGYPAYDTLEALDQLLAYRGCFRDAKSLITQPPTPKIPGSKTRYRANKFWNFVKECLEELARRGQ